MDRFTIKRLIAEFLQEDIGTGDITTEAIFSGNQSATAVFAARATLVACGFGTVVPMVFEVVDPAISCRDSLADGSQAQAGNQLLVVHGNVASLLLGERVALNLAQRLCGIATLTDRFVRAVAPLPVKIVDTRKTTPGLRVLEKYAVRAGGGSNHRFNLADGVLIKDNHIMACGSIAKAVAAVRERAPHTLRIEVEAENLDQVEEGLAAGVDIIMLDNMDIDTMRQAVMRIGQRALVEASGGVTLDNVRAIAETGVDIISIGALTHSAPACDIGMDMLPG
jgi:nicotinate-nucleotide pyrophosphorylase (carboxylating)